MKGKDLIKWIQENHAEELPVMIRREKKAQKEYVEQNDLEIKVSVCGDENQMQYRKYFLI